MDALTIAEKTSSWIRSSILLKLIGITILVLLLLIPASMLQTLIYERSTLQNNAINEICQNWSNGQTVTGPVLTIPYTIIIKKDSNQIIRDKKYIHYLPEQLTINGQITPSIRKRGIYKASLYESTLDISGKFDLPVVNAQHLGAEKILYDEAFLQIGIPDMRGINNKVSVMWNGIEKTAEPGLPVCEIVRSGIHVPLHMLESSTGSTFPFQLNLKLKGSDTILFTPVGKETHVTITSPWSSPSFYGAFLPEKRTITDKGFSAEWNILHFNRNYPQSWIGSGYDIGASSFGVRIITPVQHYQMVTRSVKYAALIILLTFVVFFMVEITRKYKIHPFQYLLIGAALILFYALLLSISEQITFGIAYLIAAGATTFMLSLYTLSILRKISAMLTFSALFTTMFGFLYVILQSEDYALLLGSTGLFLLLGVIMFLTRKINWYKDSAVVSEES
jgi:inner membrane protein